MTDPGHIDWYPTDEERAARRKDEIDAKALLEGWRGWLAEVRRIRSGAVAAERERMVPIIRRWHEALVLANCPDPDKYPEDAEAHLAALDEMVAMVNPEADDAAG